MQNQIPDYKNKNLSFEERAKDLVSRMTLEEKVTQMLHSAPAIPRLGIKAYNYGMKPFMELQGQELQQCFHKLLVWLQLLMKI